MIKNESVLKELSSLPRMLNTLTSICCLKNLLCRVSQDFSIL